MTSVIQLTDASRELATLGQLIRQSEHHRGQNVLFGFSKFLDVDPTRAIYFELLSVVRNRIHNLELFATRVVDPELDDGLRQEVINATGMFGALFSLSNLVSPWENARTSSLPDANLKTLMWFGQTARRHRPLRVVNEEDRQALLGQIDEAIADLTKDEAPDWTKPPLLDGLRRMRIVLQYLRFFGHDVAIEELILFNRKVVSVQEVHKSRQRVSDDAASLSFMRILNVIALLGAVFILPDEMKTAWDRYDGWQQQLLMVISKQPSEQKLLSPPSVVLPKLPKLPE